MTQAAIRNGVVHVQVGSRKNYEKFDLELTPALAAAFDNYAGPTNGSLYGSDTQYVPVEVREERIVTLSIPSAPLRTRRVSD